MNVEARREGTVRVRDGRAVGFAEWGDPNGRPVVVFHGGPGTRRLAVGCEDRADELEVRLVCLERPGFGLSDFAPDRTLIGWADDVADATRALDMGSVVVLGVSAGSPYALACGALLPSLIRQVGVIGGMAPPQFRAQNPFAELLVRDRPEAESAVRRYFEAMRADVEGSVVAMADRAGPDRAVYSRPDVQERFRQTRREAFRSGVDGAVLDLVLLNEPWGFDLADIRVTTRWWHGSMDPVSPLQTVRHATAAVHDLEFHVYENEGHAIGFTHGADILRALTRHT